MIKGGRQGAVCEWVAWGSNPGADRDPPKDLKQEDQAFRFLFLERALRLQREE